MKSWTVHFVAMGVFFMPRLLAASDLSEAVERNATYSAYVALRNGVNPNETLDGRPLLAHAVEANNFELCRVLLNHGADPNVEMDALGLDSFLSLTPESDEERLAIFVLVRTHRFLKGNLRAANQELPSRPELVVIAEPTIDYFHPKIAPYYFVDNQEQAGKENADDDGDGFVDEVYGWGVTTNRAHETNLWQRKLYSSDAKLIQELFAIHNRLERSEISEFDPAYRKLRSSYRNPIAALFGTNSGYSDAHFLDAIIDLSHGSHVAGTIIDASDRQAKIHTLSWENFGQVTDEEIGYPEVTGNNPLLWLEQVRKHRFPRLIAMGRRCSDFLRSLDPGVVNASLGLPYQTKVDRAVQVFNEMKAFDSSIPEGVITLIANELYAYDSIPFFIPVAENPQILFVAAAGNRSEDVDRAFSSPAFFARLFPNVLAVAALGVDGELAEFSNYGRKSVSLAAPGERIESLGVAGSGVIMSGTSMAAPHVSGFAAQYRRQHPELTGTSLAHRIELGATRPKRQKPLRVSSRGSHDPYAVRAIGNGERNELLELGWRLVATSPEERPELWEEALQLFDKGEKQHANDADFVWILAILRDQCGMFPEALQAIDQALKLAPLRPEFWLSRSLILHRMNRMKPVIELADAFEKTFPTNLEGELESFRRDVLALAIDAAMSLKEAAVVDRLKPEYLTGVGLAGRADGMGEPQQWGSAWNVLSELVPFQRPTGRSRFSHFYRLSSQADAPLQVDLYSTDFDAVILIRTPSGDILENDDHEGRTDRARIRIDAPTKGDYILKVTTLRPGDVGEYLVEVQGASLSRFEDEVVVPGQHRRP